MNCINSIDTVIDVKSYPNELNSVVENVWKWELQKHGTRTKELVTRHVAMGLAAELVLIETKYFTLCAPYVDDVHKKVSFANLKSDLVCENKRCEVKTSNPKYKTFYISSSQLKSIHKCIKHNDVMIVMNREDLGNLTYRVTPKYLIDIQNILKYIVSASGTGSKSEYMFDHYQAMNNDHCIQLGV